MTPMPPKVLIVDDEPHMLRVTELSLRKGGFTLLTARNGREALEAARRELPSLVVMDVLMPEMDGLTALRQLRRDPLTAAIPVIMLTARGHVMTRTEAEESGATLFLTKPFSPAHLLQEARRLIGPDSNPNPNPAPAPAPPPSTPP